jgi:ATP-dependent RNA helicase SUPV3L1/SUV3
MALEAMGFRLIPAETLPDEVFGPPAPARIGVHRPERPMRGPRRPEGRGMQGPEGRGMQGSEGRGMQGPEGRDGRRQGQRPPRQDAQPAEPWDPNTMFGPPAPPREFRGPRRDSRGPPPRMAPRRPAAR